MYDVLDPTGTVRQVPQEELSNAFSMGGFYLSGGDDPVFELPDGTNTTAKKGEAPTVIQRGGMLLPTTKVQVLDPTGKAHMVPAGDLNTALARGGMLPDPAKPGAVSYTHLTLPTKRIV